MAETSIIGRPSKYDPNKHPAEVEYYAGEGMTNQEIAASMDINACTINDWMNKYPEFSDAIKRGRKIADDKVEKSLYKRAMGMYVEETKRVDDGNSVRVETTSKYIADTTAMIFWLKNRKPQEWRDKIDHSLSGSVRITSAKELSDDELAKIAAGEK